MIPRTITCHCSLPATYMTSSRRRHLYGCPKKHITQRLWTTLEWDAHHDGATYVPELDKIRLNAQQERVRAVMMDAEWHGLAELSQTTGDPEASISARLRDLRKPKFGGFTVERRRVGNGTSGYFEYRLDVVRPVSLHGRVV